jgi:hypothetical protein
MITFITQQSLAVRNSSHILHGLPAGSLGWDLVLVSFVLFSAIFSHSAPHPWAFVSDKATKRGINTLYKVFLLLS